MSRVVTTAVRPASWAELGVAMALGFLTGVWVAAWVFAAGQAWAGGPVALTWSQASDCAEVTGWELMVAPITTANPNPQPTNAVVGVSFANAGSPCGLNMSRTVTTTSGVGATRFWLRAYAGNGTRSDVSNAIDQSMPLGKPSGLTVAIP